MKVKTSFYLKMGIFIFLWMTIMDCLNSLWIKDDIVFLYGGIFALGLFIGTYYLMCQHLNMEFRKKIIRKV